MKKKYSLYYLLVLGIMATACTRNDNIIEGGNASEMEIRLTTGVTGGTSTKADEEEIAEDQQVGVFIFSRDNTDTLWVNLAYVVGENGGLSIGERITYPEYFDNTTNGSGVNILAYHPYNSTFDEADSLYFQVKTDQKQDKGYHDSDLLFSKAEFYERQSEAHVLTFTHQLTKITYSLKPGNDMTEANLMNAVISLVNLQDSIFFGLNTGIDTLKRTGGAVEIFTHTTDSAAIIVPQMVAKNTPFFKIELDSTIVANNDKDKFMFGILNKDEDIYFKPGQIYHYIITVSNTGLQFTTSVEPWSQDGDGTINGDGKVKE